MTTSNKKSQASQDYFVAKALGYKGYYLDIGCSDGFEQSNSFILETEFSWDGLMIDNNHDLINQCRQNRTNQKSFVCDATNRDSIIKILLDNNAPKTIDYISLDVDDASLNALRAFPVEDYEFKIMTFEHDIYNQKRYDTEKKVESRKLLFNLGYKCITENVLAYQNSGPYEDWFYNPKYFNDTIFSKLIGSKNLSGQQVIDLLYL
jgi:hypothetical protein